MTAHIHRRDSVFIGGYDTSTGGFLEALVIFSPTNLLRRREEIQVLWQHRVFFPIQRGFGLCPQDFNATGNFLTPRLWTGPVTNLNGFASYQFILDLILDFGSRQFGPPT